MYYIVLNLLQDATLIHLSYHKVHKKSGSPYTRNRSGHSSTIEWTISIAAIFKQCALCNVLNVNSCSLFPLKSQTLSPWKTKKEIPPFTPSSSLKFSKNFYILHMFSLPIFISNMFVSVFVVLARVLITSDKMSKVTSTCWLPTSIVSAISALSDNIIAALSIVPDVNKALSISVSAAVGNIDFKISSFLE